MDTTSSFDCDSDFNAFPKRGNRAARKAARALLEVSMAQVSAEAERRMLTEHGVKTRIEWRFLLMSLHCQRLDGRDLTPEMTATFNEFWPATTEGGMHSVLNRIHDEEASGHGRWSR